MIKPTTHGAVRSFLRVGAFHMTEAWYPPRTVVPEHDHLRPGWTLTLSGTYVERFGQNEAVLPTGAVVAKPATARHSNRYGSAGARCLLIGVEPDRVALDRVSVHDTGPVPKIMQRIHTEFVARNAACALVLEGLALELAAYEIRLAETPRHGPPPPWLARVREQLHASLACPPTFASLAHEAGVHPVHLSRAFRRAYGATPGEYSRRIRIEHARRLLARSTKAISQVANLVGFCDQSHFTRVFKDLTGLPPARYRALYRPFREDV